MATLELPGHRDCDLCSLSKTRQRVVPGTGSLEAKIIVVGEAPGREEDEQGAPFVGPSGQILRQVLESAGVREEHLFFSNIYQCRPKNNDVALTEASPCPSIWLNTELSSLNRIRGARVILAAGLTAVRYFRSWILPSTMTMRDESRRDTRWPDPETGPFWVVALYHPSALLRAGGIREGNVMLVSMVDSIMRGVAYAQN